MFIPEVLLCIGLHCMIGSGEPQPTLERCRTALTETVIPLARRDYPHGNIRATRCRHDPGQAEL